MPVLPSDKIVNFSSDSWIVPLVSGVPRTIPILALSRGAIDQKLVDPAFLFVVKDDYDLKSLLNHIVHDQLRTVRMGVQLY